MVRYHNYPKFSDWRVWANSADRDQTASLYPVFHSVHISHVSWTNYSIVKSHNSNFRIITAISWMTEFSEFCSNFISCLLLRWCSKFHMVNVLKICIVKSSFQKGKYQKFCEGSNQFCKEFGRLGPSTTSSPSHFGPSLKIIPSQAGS